MSKEIILLTGLSGAGKSVAIKALEDIGFFCADNMLPEMIEQFLDICTNKRSYEKIAVAIDIRVSQPGEPQNYFEKLAIILQKLGIKIIFLEASEETIIRRYKETRREHPLCTEKNDNIITAIAKEYEILSPLREIASFIINTSLTGTAKLKEEVVSIFCNPIETVSIKICSYGFKFGPDTSADLCFDVRCLPNPFYVKELKNKTGLDSDVQKFIMNFDSSRKLLEKLQDLFEFILPLYINEGKTKLVISFGCTGGKHRSVTFAENIGEFLTEKGYRITIQHRDIKR